MSQDRLQQIYCSELGTFFFFAEVASQHFAKSGDAIKADAQCLNGRSGQSCRAKAHRKCCLHGLFIFYNSIMATARYLEESNSTFEEISRKTTI